MIITLKIIAWLVVVVAIAHVARLSFCPWDRPMNSVSLWWSRANLRRCSIGWSDLKGKRDNHSFWWAIAGFSGTVLLQTWPWGSRVWK